MPIAAKWLKSGNDDVDDECVMDQDANNLKFDVLTLIHAFYRFQHYFKSIISQLSLSTLSLVSKILDIDFYMPSLDEPSAISLSAMKHANVYADVLSVASNCSNTISGFSQLY